MELDEDGAAWVKLPEYFEALNRDFCYQLTPIGAPAPALHVAEEVSENTFKIAGGHGRMRVSWQITGIRNDRWAEAHPRAIEQEKPAEERGYYLHPALYGEPEERGMRWARHGEHMQQMEERVRQMEERRRQAEEHMRQRRTKGVEESPSL